jgi:hypothetical protein
MLQRLPNIQFPVSLCPRLVEKRNTSFRTQICNQNQTVNIYTNKSEFYFNRNWNASYSVLALNVSRWQTYVVLFIEIYHILFWNMWENASIREAATTGWNIWEMLEYLRLAYKNAGNMCELTESGMHFSNAWWIHVINIAEMRSIRRYS